MKTLLIIITAVLLCTNVSAQEIIPYSGAEKNLENRWQWASEKANQTNENKYWIVYTFERLMNQNSYIGSFNRHYKDETKLGELLYPNAPKDYFESLNYLDHNTSKAKVKKELALLFRIRKGKIIDTQISTIDLPFQFEKLPIYWLGIAEEQESIKLIIRKYDQIKDPEAKESLVSAAGMHKNAPQSFDFLKEIIENEKDSELREDAVFWIGHLDDKKAIPLLINIAKNDRSEDVAEKAVFSLHNIESDTAVDALIDLAKNLRNGDVREKAIFWVGQLASKKAEAALNDIVYSDEETEIQEKAVFALSQLDDGRGVTKLIKIAKTHPNKAVRKKAIFWLGQSEDDRALDALIEMVQK
ncbi:MAG: HEAT repeat domain-containing protein [Calditrichaeota bacterium]|nr:HEAT repeat domain-containing protein [Calditrichota bacterium]